MKIVSTSGKIHEVDDTSNPGVVSTAGASPFYNLRPILGNFNWAIFYILLGGRQAGKSYSVTDFFLHQFTEKNIPFYWLRLTETQSRKLLTNNAERLVDPDLRRRYNLDITTNSTNVYQVTKRTKPDVNGKTKIVEKKLIARVLALSTFYQDKGSLFDKDFLDDPNMVYNIAIDEFQREKGEKNTFDILYALTNQLENLVRNTKKRIRVFFLGNTLEEASEILAAFNFIPEEFGRYKLKSKRCLIDYIEPSEQYKKMRAGSIAEILMPTASTFTNKIATDDTLIDKNTKLVKPQYIIKFTKDKSNWFTVWNNNIVTKFNGEQVKAVAMRPYLDELFSANLQANIINIFDTRSFLFRNMIDFKRFQSQLELLKPRK